MRFLQKFCMLSAVRPSVRQSHCITYRPAGCAYGFARFSSSQSTSYSAITTTAELKALLATPHPNNNVTSSIIDKIGRNLHCIEDHPLGIIKKRIENYCSTYAAEHKQPSFQSIDSLLPVVDTKSCFDDLLVGPDHVSRRPTDTYYLNQNTVLRTHTSAHQCHYISAGTPAFLCTGDVYRRDEIDASHYPVFHQMEGVRIFEPGRDFPAGLSKEEKKKVIEDDLKNILTGLARHLFGDVEMRWRSDFFPFTDPSFELEVQFKGAWMEVLGCGVIHDQVLRNANKDPEVVSGWAFGLGLERLAMVLFAIPDIRLFWTEDVRFLKQFKANQITKFVPYSKFPACYKDVSFWLPETGVHQNDVFEVIRGVAGDLVESVKLIDEFTNKKNGKSSQAYRINYRHMDRNLLNEEVDEVQERVRQELTRLLRVQLR